MSDERIADLERKMAAMAADIEKLMQRAADEDALLDETVERP